MEPPALPVKQHRSHSSRCSSAGHDSGPLSPVELHSSNAYNDVFPEATDCHAAQCPIHQRYDSSQHLMRFFSDDTPPPVPRKRLARTLSLPCAEVPPPSPLSPILRPPRDFDNPLYMMMPVRGRRFAPEAEQFDPCGGGSGPSSLSPRVSVDTPDAQLSHLFGSFTDQREVLQGIQHCHLAFLRSMAQRVDAALLLQRDSRGVDVDSCLPQDFVLQPGSKARQVGGAAYYRLHSPKFPGRLLALKVHRQNDESLSAAATHQPPHANVQELVAHFRPTDVTSSGRDDAPPLRPDTEEPKPASVQSFLQRGHLLSVVRDLPLFTLEDFVQGGASLQASDFDGRLSALMLQVLTGLAHLYRSGGSVSELRPREIFLVWPEDGGKNRAEESSLPEETEEKSAKIGVLWQTHGCPRVVLIPAGSSLPGPRALLYVKSRMSALIHFCLQSRDSRTCAGPGAAPSSQRRELLRLASWLQGDGGEGAQLEAAVAALQELLWGPGVPLCEPWGHHWLTVKRALFVVKLAERGLSPDRRALPWEDVMRLKYLSSADGEAAVGVRG